MGDRYTIAGYGVGAVAAFQPPSPPRMPPLLLHQLLAVASLLTTTAGGSVILGSAGNVCPSSYTKLTTLPSCRAGLRLAGHYGDSFNGDEDDSDWPSGCYYCDDVDGCKDGAWLNTHSSGSASGNARPYCSSGFTPLAQGETLFVGDSDIDYWDASISLITPSYNVGYGGYTCEDVLGEVATMSDAFAPSTVVLVCGENDLASGTSVSDAFGFFTQVADRYIAAGSRVITIGTKPEPGTTSLHSQYDEYDGLIKDRAETLASAASGLPPLVVIDSNAGFVALGNGADLYAEDDLHLSTVGYGHWGEWLEAAVGAGGGDESCYLWRSGACVAGGGGGTTATAVDCDGSYGDWGECSVTCDGGTQTRSYAVSREPANGGVACPADTEMQACNSDACPSAAVDKSSSSDTTASIILTLALALGCQHLH
jgi:hypothetical protein